MIGSRHIRLVEDKVSVRTVMLALHNRDTQCMQPIKLNPHDVFSCDHQDGGEIPAGVVYDKAHHVRVRLGDGMDWQTVHSWQKFCFKQFREALGGNFSLDLFLKEVTFLFTLWQAP